MGTSIAMEELIPLASGGMGTTQLARLRAAQGFERLVVVKRLHAQSAADPNALRRLIEEAELAGMVHHANVVSVQHVGQDEQGIYLVLDYIEGCSLGQLMSVSRPDGVQLGVALRIVHDALMGLEAIHTACNHAGEPLCILHRDVTPENILIGVDGVARLTDFGIAKGRGSSVHTAPSTVVGKLGYMAPEYILGHEVGPGIDVYAMGITLWSLLSGSPPWGKLPRAKILSFSLEHDVPGLDPALALPEGLVRLVQRACARNANQRISSAREFVREMDKCCGGLLASRYDVADYVQLKCDERIKDLRNRLTTKLRDCQLELVTESNQPLSVRSAQHEVAPDVTKNFGVITSPSATELAPISQRPTSVEPTPGRLLGLASEAAAPASQRVTEVVGVNSSDALRIFEDGSNESYEPTEAFAVSAEPQIATAVLTCGTSVPVSLELPSQAGFTRPEDFALSRPRPDQPRIEQPRIDRPRIDRRAAPSAATAPQTAPFSLSDSVVFSLPQRRSQSGRAQPLRTVALLGGACLLGICCVGLWRLSQPGMLPNARQTGAATASSVSLPLHATTTSAPLSLTATNVPAAESAQSATQAVSLQIDRPSTQPSAKSSASHTGEQDELAGQAAEAPDIPVAAEPVAATDRGAALPVEPVALEASREGQVEPATAGTASAAQRDAPTNFAAGDEIIASNPYR